MTNEELRAQLQQQPIGIAMYTTGMMMAYNHGVLTEDFLHFSNPNWEVNHGVVLVGYGKVND